MGQEVTVVPVWRGSNRPPLEPTQTFTLYRLWGVCRRVWHILTSLLSLTVALYERLFAEKGAST